MFHVKPVESEFPKNCFYKKLSILNNLQSKLNLQINYLKSDKFMKIEILMLLESEMKGNNPTILNENEYEIEEIELFDEDDDFSSESSANKFKIVEMDDISKCQLNSDYNYTDTTRKKYRYQAVYDMVHF